MKSKVNVSVIGLGLLGALALVALVARPWKTSARIPLIQPKASVFYAKEDPLARQRYDQMRLRNPRTGKIPAGILEKERQFAQRLPKRVTGALGKAGVLASEWTTMGPYNVGGRTRALGVDRRNDQIILAAGVSGAMYRSTNGGATWTNVTPPDALHNATCLVQDERPGHEDTWYYGTGEYTGNSADARNNAWYNGRGVYRSTDNGLTWQIIPRFDSGDLHRFDKLYDFVWNLALDASNTAQDEIYVATYGGIYQSTNGTDFDVVLGDSPWSSIFTDVAVASDGVVYAAMSNADGSAAHGGLWRSPDGVNWTNITPTAWPSTYRRTVVGIAPSDPNLVYFLCHAPGYGQNETVLWRYTYLAGDGSGDAGGLWQELTANLPAFGGLNGDYSPQGSYNMFVKIKPNDPDVVFLGGTNLYRSTDGFTSTANTTWIGGYSLSNNNTSYTNQHADQHALVFLPGAPDKMIAGHDGGLSRTLNNLAASVTWSSLNKGYYTTQFYSVAIDPATSGSRAIVGGLQDNGTYAVHAANPTTSWNQVLGADGGYCAMTPGADALYVSWQYGNIFRLTLDANGNELTWAEIDPEGADYNLMFSPLVMDPNNPNMLYIIARDRIWRNTNTTGISTYNQNPTSVNWTALTNTASPSDTMLSAIAVSKQPANRIYYGTATGKIYRLDNAHEGNPTPMDCWTGKGLPTDLGAYVSCLAVHPDNADKVIAVYSNYECHSLYYSANGGTTWTAVGGNLEENLDGTGAGPSTRWAAWMPWQGQDWLFVGSSTGLYSTTHLNGMSTQWAQEGANSIGNVLVDMVVTRPLDGWVVAATHGKGMFASTIQSDVDDQGNQPQSLTLLPNYPNPFNPETTLSFNTDRTQPVRLEVFDIRGRKVATLADETLEPGTHKRIFQGRDLASGTYLVRLTAGEQVLTQKINLVK